MNKKNLILILALPLLIMATRLAPHWPNVAPVTAVALAAGVYLGKKWALILPLTALFVSDIFVGFYDWPLMLTVYGSFAIIGLFSWWLKKNKNVASVVATSLVSSVFFFLATNLAVFVFSPWYSKDLAGLIYCFELALPFFRYTLLGDLFYVTVIFGAFELVRLVIKQRRLAEIEVEKYKNTRI